MTHNGLTRQKCKVRDLVFASVPGELRLPFGGEDRRSLMVVFAGPGDNIYAIFVEYETKNLSGGIEMFFGLI
jgi:hypothetical protein